MNKGIIAAITAVGTFCLTLGLSYPHLSLVLEHRGLSTAIIGFNSAMTPLGILISSPLIPGWARIFGAWRVTVISLILTALFLFLLAIFPHIYIWFPLRFFLGIAINVIFVVSETWINQLAPNHQRGRIIGLYVTIASAGFSLGPLALAAVGSRGWPPFLIGIAGPLAALPILMIFRIHLPQFEGRRGASVWQFFHLAPLLLFAVGAAALYDQSSLAFLPIYGLRHGLAESSAALALAVLAAGNILCQIPIGWLADRISRAHLLVFLACGGVAGAVGLPWLIGGTWILWPMLFTWGALAFGTYTVALAELGDKFNGTLLVTGSGAFALMWGIGGFIGAPLTGLSINLIGPNGFPLILGLTYGLLGIAACLIPLYRPQRAATVPD